MSKPSPSEFHRQIEYGIRIIYTDNHILVTGKPPNLLTQSDRSGDPDLQSILKSWIEREYNKPGRAFIALIQRLDRPVGGVLVLARTSKAAARLCEQVRCRQLGKTYLAVVHGQPRPAAGQLVHYLIKNKARNISIISDHEQAAGREARLHYQTLQIKKGLSLLRIELETGRPHQIRAQMKAIGCPLYGDRKYGSAINVPSAAPLEESPEPMALWSHRLRLIHPIRREAMEFIDQPPWKQFPWSVFVQPEDKKRLVRGICDDE